MRIKEHILEKFQIGSVSRWRYFEIMSLVKKKGCPGILGMWYDFARHLNLLENDLSV